MTSLYFFRFFNSGIIHLIAMSKVLVAGATGSLTPLLRQLCASNHIGKVISIGRSSTNISSPKLLQSTIRMDDLYHSCNRQAYLNQSFGID